MERNADGTYTCGHAHCQCTVADDDRHPHRDGVIYCCEACAAGRGCDHPDCACAGRG